jgi:hypothetical protein
MDIKLFAAAAVFFIGGSAPILADDQEHKQEGYMPRPNDMMVETQLRHFKLWYAGAVQNWPLANYELMQIRDSIEDARRFYPNHSSSDMSAMSPVADELDNAIKAKDSAKFTSAFTKLTAACNSCHQAAGFEFIRIREPRLSPIETSPFSDESFSGK